ncbi:sigma-54 interaction domain-containing protein [Niallia sp. 01092]|uniref:sigma-54 interaction domain-containing protein n=1 Tax=unclassified Niallia TaxID=2837522 RepID=UPI003FCF8F79
MFKNAPLQLDRSFTIVEQHTPLAEIKSKLQEYNFVVVTGETYFIIGNYEFSLMNLGDEFMPVLDWLDYINWLPSSVSVNQVISSEVDWRRPVLFKDQEKYVGVLTVDKWMEQREEENRQTSAYFHGLAEMMNDSVTAVDKDGNVICWNSTAEETYKIKKEDIIGEKIGHHFSDESIILHRILNEGRPVRGEYHRPNKDMHVLINASPIIIENKIIGGIATEHDITKIIRLNEELDSNSTLLVDKLNPFVNIVSENPKFQKTIKIAQKVAHADIPVHIKGETGSGKEMIAQAIHYGGAKADGPFITVNCSVIPPALLEMELFGFQKGAFTKEKPIGQTGKIEQALNGTLFIEDIDKMPLPIQEKLLNYFVDDSFYRIGGEDKITSHTRIITSTSQSLDALLKDGNFNEKLYYKLSVIHIDIPPLRTRKEDIMTLVEKYVQEFSLKYQKTIPVIHQDAMKLLVNYKWPGNIRELRNIIERIILLNDMACITIEQIPENLKTESNLKNINGQTSETASQELTSINTEVLDIEEALRKTYGNKSAAASLLGISRGTLYNKIKEYGLS